MANYKIVPLALGRFKDYETSWLLYNNCCGQKTTALISAFLIRGAGVNILVDTGSSSPEDAAKHYHAPFEQTADQQIVAALQAQGLAPADITCIVHTHLHWDHCYNDGLFGDCKIYLQKQELKYAIAPLPFQYDEYETPHLGHSYPWQPHMHRFELVDGDKELLPGINLIFLPGHSRGFQGVLVQTEAGKQMIAGDALPLYENWFGVKAKKPIPSSVHVNTRDCLDSYEKMRVLSDYIWAGRDPRILEGTCICVNRNGEGGDELGCV